MKSEIELHAHLYFDRYGLEDVLKVMKENGLDVLASLYLNEKAFPDIQQESSKLSNKGWKVDSDSLAVRLEKDENSFYILKGAELETKDSFHVITIGSDNIKPYQLMREMVAYGLEQESLVIFDHPFVDNNNASKEISQFSEEEAIRICKEYSGQIALEWNGYCIPLVRKMLGGRDVNRDIVELSDRLYKEGYNNPIVTDTDLHARKRGALNVLGTSRIISEINLDSGRAIVDSLRDNIFSGDYENTYKTVPLSHFIPHWGLPYLFRKIVHRPRG